VKTLVLLVVLAGAAHAGPMVKPPAGWTGGPDAELVRRTGTIAHFGGARGAIEAERYDAPKPGVVLYVTRVAANADAPAAVAPLELDNVHPSAESALRPTRESQGVDPARRQLVAGVGWRDSTSHVTGDARIVIAATTSRVVAVKGECLAAEDAPPALVDACAAALETLDPGIDVKDRVELAFETGSAAPPAPTTPTASSPQPSLSDGSHVPLPPLVIPQDRPPADRRPVFVGLGIAILAAVFWWNSRRRARYEHGDAEQESDDR